MLRRIRTYRILPATVAVALVLGLAAPVAHAVCVSVMNVEEDCGGHARLMAKSTQASHDESTVTEHTHGLPVAEVSDVPAVHMAATGEIILACCTAGETPVSPEIACCLISAEGAAATLTAVPHLPTVKMTTVSRADFDTYHWALNTAPTTSFTPPQVVPGASSQSILSVFLI